MSHIIIKHSVHQGVEHGNQAAGSKIQDCDMTSESQDSAYEWLVEPSSPLPGFRDPAFSRLVSMGTWATTSKKRPMTHTLAVSCSAFHMLLCPKASSKLKSLPVIQSHQRDRNFCPRKPLSVVLFRGGSLVSRWGLRTRTCLPY